VFDAATGSRQAELVGHTGAVFSVRFSHDGRSLLTASEDATAKLWRTADWTIAGTLEGHGDRVLSASFSSDDALVLTGSFDATVRLWDASTSRLLAVLQGHRDAVFPVTFDPTGTRAASASWDGFVISWDIARETRSLTDIDARLECLVPFVLRQGQPWLRAVPRHCQP